MSKRQELKNILIYGNPHASEPVRRFEAVAKITWLLSIVSYLASYIGHELSALDGINLRLGGILMILNLFLIYYISWSGERWAKWVYLAFQIVGFASFLLLVPTFLMTNFFAFLITLFQYELGAYAIYLVFELDQIRPFNWISRSRVSK